MLYNDVDFRNGSDTGEPEAAAIQPYLDGEPAGQGVFRRPVENTRSRSDLLRQVLREHLVLRDLQQVLLVGGGIFTFGGAKPTYTGVFTTTADLEVRPFATPGADASPYTVSTKASLLVGSVDIIKFESKYKQWQDPGADPDITAEADMISVEIVHTGALSVAVQGAAGQQNNVYVTINYGTTTCQEVIDAVNVHTGANKLVVASLASGTNTNPASKFSTAEWSSDWSVRFLRGGAPGLLHVVTSAVLATFFAAHVDNPLRKGDTLAIWYDKLIELRPVAPPPGGRLQSTPENSNYSIPAGSLFNTRREPEKIPNCIPLCKCIDDNTVVFVDGSRIIRGTPASLWWDSQHILSGSSSPIDYSAWTRVRYAPGAHVPPTTVQQALDNVDDVFEAILNGTQPFVASAGNHGLSATGSDGGHPGVIGLGSVNGNGVEGYGGATSGHGVNGVAVGNAAHGVCGTKSTGNNGAGVYGEATGGSGNKGVIGMGTSGGDGVYGESPAGAGVHGKAVGGGGYGIEGESETNSAVYGHGGGLTGAGVYGVGNSTTPAPGVRGVGGAGKPGVEGSSFALISDETVMIQLPLASFHADIEGDEATKIWRYNHDESDWALDSWTMVNTGDSAYNLFGDFVLPHGFTTCGGGIRWKAETADLATLFTCRFERARFTPSATIPAPGPAIVEIATIPHPQTNPDIIINTYAMTGMTAVTFNHAPTYSDMLRVQIQSYTARRWVYQVFIVGHIAAPNCYHRSRDAA